MRRRFALSWPPSCSPLRTRSSPATSTRSSGTSWTPSAHSRLPQNGRRSCRRRPRSGASSTAGCSTSRPAGWSPELGFYTIGSAGHEGNAAVAAALRPDRPGAAALPLRRVLPRPRRRRPAGTGVRDVLLGLAAAADEPIAGGRHKVFGHARPRGHPADLHDRVAPAAGRRGRRSRSSVPARSASACRVAGRRDRGLQLRRRLGQPRHRAGRVQHRRVLRAPGLPLPILFVCEDNGLGISVRTPAGWVASALRARPQLRIFAAPRATTRNRRSPSPASWRSACAATAAPRCCTCAPSG